MGFSSVGNSCSNYWNKSLLNIRIRYNNCGLEKGKVRGAVYAERSAASKEKRGIMGGAPRSISSGEAQARNPSSSFFPQIDQARITSIRRKKGG
jgi:hypothetical protein